MPACFISQYSGARLQPSLRSEALEGPIDTLPFAAIASFLSKPSVLTKDQALRAPHILAFRDHHMIGGTGHEAYVRNLNGTLNQRFAVMHVGEEIRDPESNDLVGYQAAYVATAVVSVPGEDVTKTVLTEGAREALQGDRLISQEGEMPLTFKPHAPTSAINGQIIGIADDAHADRPVPGGCAEPRHPARPRAGRGAGGGSARRTGARPVRSLAVEKDPFGKMVRLPYERAGTLIVFKVFDRISYGP